MNKTIPIFLVTIVLGFGFIYALLFTDFGRVVGFDQKKVKAVKEYERLKPEADRLEKEATDIVNEANDKAAAALKVVLEAAPSTSITEAQKAEAQNIANLFASAKGKYQEANGKSAAASDAIYGGYGYTDERVTSLSSSMGIIGEQAQYCEDAQKLWEFMPASKTVGEFRTKIWPLMEKMEKGRK